MALANCKWVLDISKLCENRKKRGHLEKRLPLLYRVIMERIKQKSGLHLVNACMDDIACIKKKIIICGICKTEEDL